MAVSPYSPRELSGLTCSTMSATIPFDPDLIRRYDQPGPRYTSYPTAVQFTEAFTFEDYQRVADQTNIGPDARPLSLYVHIPFCHQLCYYCACTKIVTRHQENADKYLDRLGVELELQTALFDRSRAVEQLHFGGGTPTYLDDEQMDRLLAMLDEHFTLVSDGRQEYSIEVDPRTANPDTLARLAAFGFNRISFGVQDFDPVVQKAVNRLQTEDETFALIEAARKNHYNSVAIDLIYGLPRQNVPGFRRTLDTVTAKRPDRIALYNYAHLPNMFRAQRLINETDLPAPATKLELLGLAIDHLSAAGYVYIGMDHFALPEDDLVLAQQTGQLQRNFQGYSTHADCDLIGLGMSSIGKVGDCYAQNARTLNDYYEIMDSGRLAIQRGIELDVDDRLRREVIQEIMCHRRVEFEYFEHAYSIDFDQYFADELRALETLEADGLVEVETERIRVTPRGRLLIRAVAMAFDAYLKQDSGPKRFSKVI